MIIPPLGSLAGEPGPQDYPWGVSQGEPGPQGYPWGVSQESLARKITPGNVQIWSESLACKICTKWLGDEYPDYCA